MDWKEWFSANETDVKWHLVLICCLIPMFVKIRAVQQFKLNWSSYFRWVEQQLKSSFCPITELELISEFNALNWAWIELFELYKALVKIKGCISMKDYRLAWSMCVKNDLAFCFWGWLLKTLWHCLTTTFTTCYFVHAISILLSTKVISLYQPH